MRDVGKFEVGSLPWVIGDVGDVEAETEVAHGNVVNVVFVLMESRADFRGVAVRTVDAVVPIAKVSRSRVERGGLEVRILRHVGHLLTVILQLFVVGTLAVGAVPPRPQNQFGVGVVGDGGLEFA